MRERTFIISQAFLTPFILKRTVSASDPFSKFSEFANCRSTFERWEDLFTYAFII